MIATIQSLLIILFFIVPGTIATEVNRYITPARKGTTYDITIQSLIYSTILHLPAVLIISIVLLFNKLSIEQLNKSIQNNVGTVLMILTIYFIVISLLAAIFGYKVSMNKKKWLKMLLKEKTNIVQSTSVWDYIRSESRTFIKDQPYAIRAKFNMKDGTSYYGDVIAMPAIIDDDKPYSIFIQKVIKISRDGTREELNKINGILLNSTEINTTEIKFVLPETKTA